LTDPHHFRISFQNNSNADWAISTFALGTLVTVTQEISSWEQFTKTMTMNPLLLSIAGTTGKDKDSNAE
jgi:hypothetical protein